MVQGAKTIGVASPGPGYCIGTFGKGPPAADGVYTAEAAHAHQKNKLTCNGVTYVGNQLKSGGTTPLLPANYSTFVVNGALLMGNTSGGGLLSSYNVYTTVTYDSTKALAPDITSTTQHVPKGVSILRWGLP